MEVILNVSHITRHDTEQNWADKNPILLKGEQGFITEGTHAKMHKTGDGVTNWNDLEFDKAVANGGNADTVGGFTVESNVPADLEVDNFVTYEILNSKNYLTLEELENKEYATINYVDTKIGDIGSLIDMINGEVI